MVVGTSGADPGAAPPAGAARPPFSARRIVVVGGGCYGSYYVRQLARALRAGALRVQEVWVVDRDPACRAGAELAAGRHDPLPARLVVGEWLDVLGAWWAGGAEALEGDHLVPSPLMPHLIFDWLLARAAARWPARPVGLRPLPGPPPTPWERAAPDGRHYASFATWTCPVNCIEPARCPVTRGPRDWSLPEALERWAAGYAGHLDAPPLIFPCVHRTYGVGMIDAATVAAADARLARAGASGPVHALVGTVSHCHGALAVLAIP